MTAEIGRVLGGRYRLVAPIGLGASAQVYLADDVRLRRRVALKMLHDALAGDVEFLRRFRAEARAAAALSHPNVMAVYDWGDDDTAFIVTEYLGGGSLRALLDRGQLLTPSQALTVGLEATRALDYAHRRGFVHRDIKPANLLFGDEQRLRIADFGLARALAEAAWTEPQGAMLGTARYASPELAKGEQLNGKADVYALALVLVEAVTGEVPFSADTTLGTLMARVDRQLVVPDSLGPLQEVLARAGHPDPVERLDARALAAGLLRAAKQLPTPLPLPLAGALPRADEVIEDRDPTVHSPVIGSVQEIDLTEDDLDLDPPAWVNAAAAVDHEADEGWTSVESSANGADSHLDLSVPDRSDGGVDVGTSGEAPGIDGVDHASVHLDLEPDPLPTAEIPAATDQSDKVPDEDHGDDLAADEDLESVVLLVDPEPDRELIEVTGDPVLEPLGPSLIDLREGGSGLEGPAWADASEPDRELEPVDRVVDPSAVVDPTLVGDGRGTATSVLTRPRTAPDRLEDEPPVAAGDDGPRRRRRWPWVLLVIALIAGGGGVAAATVGDDEPAPVVLLTLPVPTLEGVPEAEAVATAEAAGWVVDVTRERRDDSNKGEVLESVPGPGVRLDRGDRLALTISDGQTMKPVPQDLSGQPLDQATAELLAAGFFTDGTQQNFDEKVAKGSVLRLAEGTPTELERGSTVSVVVSKGPEPRTVPAGLQGSTEAAATEAIESLGLKVAVNRSYSDSVKEGIVISTLPRAGSQLARGETVTIEVSRGPEQVAVPDVRSASTPAEAAAILRAAGLVPGSASGSAEGSPVGTEPGRGTSVDVGSTVDIVLG